jgi:hypothetical protein
MSTKRSPEQIWKELEAQARDEEAAEELASKSDAELGRELAGAGFDVNEEKAQAQAFRQKLERSVAERRAKLAAQREKGEASRAAAAGDGKSGTLADERAHAPRPLRRRMAAYLAAGATAAAAASALVAYRVPGPVGGAMPDAKTLRHQGLDACTAQKWQQCLEKLDLAREDDPQGDNAPEVQAARRAAEEALHPKTPPAP